MHKVEKNGMSIVHAGASALIATSGGVTFAVLGLIEAVGVIDPMSLIEKLGIAGVVMVGAYFFSKYLLKQNDNLKTEMKELQTQINKFHEDRLEETKQRTAELTKQLEEVKTLIVRK